MQTPCHEHHMAKVLLDLTVRKLHDLYMANPPNIAMMRKGKDIQIRTKEPYAKGKCVIPIFFRKPHSMVMEGEQGGVRPRNGVYCRVTWTRREERISEREKFGDVVEDFAVSVFIAPGAKLPKDIVNEAIDWTMAEEMHPFWFVQRGKEHDTTNMELVYNNVQNIMSCDPLELISKRCPANPTTECTHVEFPCLVNNVDVEADTALVLKWSQDAVVKPKEEKRKNAFDNLMAQAKAKAATQNRGTPA